MKGSVKNPGVSAVWSGQWPLDERRKGNHRPPRVLPEKSLGTAAGVPRTPSRPSFRVTAVFTETRACKDELPSKAAEKPGPAPSELC